MHIRQAYFQDIPMLRDLAKESWQAAYTDILSAGQIAYMLDMMYSEAVLKHQLDERHQRFFIFLDEQKKAIGFAGIEFHYEPNTTKLHKIYFLPGSKGKGYGKAAIRYIEAQALQQKNTRIILNVNKQNTAQYFYQSQGFLIYDEGVFDIGNGYIMDDFLMEKHFG